MVIAIGSYPIGRRFESHRRYQTACRRFAGGAFSRRPSGFRKQRPPRAVYIDGPVVKRSRHRPFTAVTRVRFSSGSPRKRRGFCLSFFVVTPFRRKRTGRNAGCSRERERSSAEGAPSGVSADSRRSLSFFVVTPFRRKRTGRNAGCSRA